MSTNLYIGNLSSEVTEADLKSNFSEAGTVVSVRIIKDKFSGQSRGFGFVEMGDDGEGQKAIAALNGTDHDGRTLNVSEARPKTERSSGGGFGRKRW